MALETGNYINDLVVTNPPGSDPLDMRPRQAANDLMALLPGHAELLAQLDEAKTALSVASANCKHLGISEFASTARRPLEVCEPSSRVLNVLTVSDPLQIINPIIPGVEVDVIDFHALDGGADECDGHKAMNKRPHLSAVAAKLNAAMAVFTFRRFKNDICLRPLCADSHAHYAAKIRNAVQGLVASNWLPNFNHIQPLLVGSSVGGAWQPAQKPAFGSYPSHAGAY